MNLTKKISPGPGMPCYLPTIGPAQQFQVTIFWNGEPVAQYTTGNAEVAKRNAEADVHEGGAGYSYSIIRQDT